MPSRNPTSDGQPARWNNSWVALAALVALFFAANFQLLAGWATEHWDGEQFFAPFFAYLSSVVRSGHWLLWNPFSNAGSPDFAEPQVGALSPITLAFAAIGGPGPVAFRLYWLAVWLFGGVGMFAYARSLGAPPWGRLLTGAGFVFSGYYLGHAQHVSVVHAISFLPWIVLRIDRALLTERRGPAMEAGALWGLAALAGNPAVTISTGLFVGAYAAIRLLDGTCGVRRIVETLGLFAVVGVMVLAPSYVSFKYESLGYSDRTGVVAREVALTENRIAPGGLTAIFDPYIPSLSRANVLWTGMDGEVSPIYFGAAPLVLALLALAAPGPRGWKWGVLGVGLLFLGFALGTSLPLRGWLYDLVPPTRYFRHPNMFRAYFIFAILALAAVASAHLERWRAQGQAPAGVLRRLAIFAAVLAVGGVGSFLWFFLQAERPGADGEIAMWHSLVAWIGLALLCASAAIWPAMLTRLPAGLVLLTLADLLGAHYLSADSAFAIGRGERDRPAPLHSPVELGPDNFARAYVSPANQHLYTHKPVYFSYAALLNGLHRSSAKSDVLMGFATGEDRVWFAKEAVEAPVSQEAFDLFTMEATERKAPVILRHRRAAMLRQDPPPALNAAAIHNAPTAEQIPFEVVTYRPNDLTLKVTCPSDGWVLLTDRWSRSWRATINDGETPIAGGNFFFRLLPVQAGENVIAMRFEPFLLWPMLITSWATLAAIGVAARLRARERAERRRQFSAESISTPPVPCGAC